MITVKTTMRDTVFVPYLEMAPMYCEYFVQYVRYGHFDGTILHRVFCYFMIQGGGFLPDMMQKATRDPVENEANNGLANTAGSIAMARTAAPHSATAQFFINVKDNGFLDYPGQDGWGYCVFGKVTSGMDVVEKIRAVDTTSRAGHSDVPADPVVIEKAEIDA